MDEADKGRLMTTKGAYYIEWTLVMTC